MVGPMLMHVANTNAFGFPIITIVLTTFKFVTTS